MGEWSTLATSLTPLFISLSLSLLHSSSAAFLPLASALSSQHTMNTSPRRRYDTSSRSSDGSTARRLVARARAIASLLSDRLRRLRRPSKDAMRVHSWIDDEDHWEGFADCEEERSLHVPGVGVGHGPGRARREAGNLRGSREASSGLSGYSGGYTVGQGSLGHASGRASGNGRWNSYDVHAQSQSLRRSVGHRVSSGLDYGHAGGRTEDAAAWRRSLVHHAVKHDRAPARWAEMVDWVEVELTNRELWRRKG